MLSQTCRRYTRSAKGVVANAWRSRKRPKASGFRYYLFEFGILYLVPIDTALAFYVQGEVFGLAMDDVDFLRKVVHVVRQVKIVGQRPCFGPPKRAKTRDVPLPESVAVVLAELIRRYPPCPITLPWQHPGGEHVTARLIVYSRDRTAAWRPVFNRWAWKPALEKAGIEQAARVDGFHALRHFYASTLLDAGESITALAEYLGHSDPGFTLKVYTHLMPSSEERTRRAVDQVFGRTRVDFVVSRVTSV